jgi:hypothetical protein
MNWKCILILILMVTPGFAKATEHFEFYRGVREMGMGGASIAVVNDQTALLLNPAGLGRLREAYVTLADPTLEINGKDDALSSGLAKLPSMTDPQKALNATNGSPGDHLHMMGEIFPSIVVPNFGIGFLGRVSEDAQVHTDGTKKFELDYTNDYAIVTGFNFRLFDGLLKLGANARLIDRSEIARNDLDPTATNLTSSALLNEGVGLASDIGLIITAPIVWLPNLAAVVRDVGGTAYTLRKGISHTNTPDSPNHTPQTIDAAVSVSPIFNRSWRGQFTFEMRDVTNAYDDQVSSRRLHGGFELNFEDALFFRGGYNEGYWTAGLEVAIFDYQIQVASYGEEIGSVGALQEDRRYMASFAIRF